MAYCGSCGEILNSSARAYCTHCGAGLDHQATVAASDPETAKTSVPDHSKAPLPAEPFGWDDDRSSSLPVVHRSRVKGRRVALVAALVILWLVVGAGVLIARDRRQSPPTDSINSAVESGPVATNLSDPELDTQALRENSASSADPSILHDQASQLDELLSSSNTGRSKLVSAVADVSSCSRIPSAIADLSAVVTNRQELLDRLDQLDTKALPKGDRLLSTLRAAVQSSLEADEHFVAWAESIEAAGGCDGSAPQDGEYRAAIQASKDATMAKRQFVKLWNPIASAEGLHVRKEREI
jgi:hypothetical protein